MLPGSGIGDISSVADLRVDFDAIEQAPAGPPQIPAHLQITRAELAAFLAQGWHATTAILPLTVTPELRELPPAGAPRLELHIQNERPEPSGKPSPRRTLDMVDLSDYGQPRHDPHGDMSVGVTAPLGLAEDEIIDVVANALIRMTEDFGFTGSGP